MRSGDPRSWMWAEALDLLQSAERPQRQFFQLGAAQGAPTWEPPADLYETGNELWILVALPGVTTDQLEVVIDGATMVVRGERPLPLGARGGPQLCVLRSPTDVSSAASRCLQEGFRSWSASSRMVVSFFACNG